MKRLLIFAALLILTACTVAESPTPTASPSPTSTATGIDERCKGCAPPACLAPQNFSTPDFLALPLADNFVFAPSSDPDCQLPCWQGLRVGESDRNDIQTMFETVFGFDESVRFYEDEGLICWPPYHPFIVPGTQGSGYAWDFGSGGRGGFQIYLPIDDETEILQGMYFFFSRANLDICNHTPQQVIMNLGTPSYMFIQLYTPVLSTEVISSTFWLVYKQGMMFEFRFSTLTEIRSQNGKEERIINYCLDKPISQLGTMILVAPFDDLWGDNLSLIQQQWIRGVVDSPGFVMPAEEVFGLTLEQIAEAARQEENPCIELDVTHLYE